MFSVTAAPSSSASTTGESSLGFGTAPVFLASVSTILGAILFLRFGYAVGNVGLWGTLVIILLGHLVTIPTVLAVSEIATNRRVAGGGAYYIISRSFGTSIGGTIGIALYISQAISIAFYLVAFAEAFNPAYAWLASIYEVPAEFDPRWVSIPSTLLLAALVLTKGASVGVRALWVVSAVLGLSIVAFLIGDAPEAIRPDGLNVTARIENGDGFGVVFATCFPAFTGMIAGLGLSGDLRNPQRSIPLGTIGATVLGMVVYAVVAVKLAKSATPDVLAGDQFVMVQIAIWGPAIYFGLGAAALSSALGSFLVAPRTLQALARDNVLPGPGLNRALQKGRGETQEPAAATWVSTAMALAFAIAGDIDFIAQILSMFFMVTYGALCSVSFLEYFAGNPSYRPTFHSRWYVSLLGALMCGLMMIQMGAAYAIISVVLMGVTYFGLRKGRHGERDLTAIFQGTMFQLTRRLQIVLQRSRTEGSLGGWRPSIVAITRFAEDRLGQFDLLRWICHRHGFGHFIEYFPGDYSFSEEIMARTKVNQMIERSEISGAGVYVDSLISPSFEQALSQVLQMPGISGLPNNSVLLEFDREHPEEIADVARGAQLVTASMFNVLVLRSSSYRFGYRSSIHVWITEDGQANASMMMLLAYIIVGHPEWRRAQIRVFVCVKSSESEDEAERLSRLMAEGRLPISRQNITTLTCKDREALEREAERRCAAADLVIAGLSGSDFDEENAVAALTSLQEVKDVLFVHASEQVRIT